MSKGEDFPEGSVEDEIVLPNENDDLFPAMTEFIVDFLKAEKSNMKLFGKIMRNTTLLMHMKVPKKLLKGILSFVFQVLLKKKWRFGDNTEENKSMDFCSKNVLKYLKN